MYKAEILADSLSPQGSRLTTMKITFPRFILAEFNTHRMFSRNSASSRAIPFRKMVQMVEENPFVPIAWQKDHSGMQGTEYFTDDLSIQFAKSNWLTAREWAVKSAKALNSSDNGYEAVTKQLCNRLLEPFMWHTVIVTSGKEGLDNFYKLRCPEYQLEERDDYDELVKTHSFKSKKEVLKQGNWYSTELKKLTTEFTDLNWLQINKSQAEIHIQAIAELMYDAMNESTPKQLQGGEWHIPFGDNIDNETLGNILTPDVPLPHNIIDYSKEKIKIATARCARISYETLGDNPKIDYEADIKLHDNLIKSEHWSPFEHIARAMSNHEYNCQVNGPVEWYSEDYISIPKPKYKGWCRNFRGFIQYRAMVDV
jgi:thymidylate synthase ThyX